MNYLVAISLFFAAARAACPNACSEHGECGEFDSCDCHAGFQGGDCSERVCLYNWAWVTTANGDLNFDGDRYDGTVYSPNIRLPETASGSSEGVGTAVLRTQSNPGGTWESWPYFSGAQEGHFYMECSNRGLCDRATGDCVCFDGYTGTACNRMRCLEDCSGRGVCQTVKDYDDTYNLWDAKMARSCKCDAGWTGPACQTRQCPFGNDVLTKTNEVYEVQYVDIFTECEGTGTITGTCQTYGVDTDMLGGYARLSFTDHFGETYETAPIQVVAMGDTADSHDGDATAAAAQAALRALPNDVIGNKVTVTAQYCETTQGSGPATLATGASKNGAIDGTVAYRVQDSDTAEDETAVVKADGTTVVAGGSGFTRAAAAGITDGDYQVGLLTRPICIRLKVNYTSMHGDLEPLTVNVDDVTYFGETNAQDNGDNLNANVGFSVTSDPSWIQGTTFSYHRPHQVRMTGTKATINDRTSSSFIVGSDLVFKQDNADANALYKVGSTYPALYNFQPGTRIKVECEYNMGTESVPSLVYRDLGVYTIASGVKPSDRSEADTANYPIPAIDETDTAIDGDNWVVTIALEEVVVPNECTDDDKTIKITQMSNVLMMSLGAVSGSATATALNTLPEDFALDLSQMQETTGIRVRAVMASGSPAEKMFDSIVHGERGIQKHTINDMIMGYYILADETGLPLNQDNDVGSNTAAITIDGDGTTENVECGDRGLCQEDGTCKCFAGYTGDSCQFQKSIAM